MTENRDWVGITTVARLRKKALGDLIHCHLANRSANSFLGMFEDLHLPLFHPSIVQVERWRKNFTCRHRERWDHQNGERWDHQRSPGVRKASTTKSSQYSTSKSSAQEDRFRSASAFATVRNDAELTSSTELFLASTVLRVASLCIVRYLRQGIVS